MDNLKYDPHFASIAPKLELGTLKTVLPAMLSDKTFPTAKERTAVVRWAQARATCTSVESQFGNATYRPPLQRYALDAENRVMATIVELYDGQLSYGEFNRRRQIIAEEAREKIEGLSRTIRAQQLALEQADRQARERVLLEQAIEAAEQEANMARQQAEEARQRLERVRQRMRSDFRQIPREVPVRPRYGCFRFGTRLACTGW